MSIAFPQYPLTNFPESVDGQRIYQDIGVDTYSNMKLYYQYINAQNFDAANALLLNDSELRKCITNAEAENRREHQILAMQSFYLSDVKKYIMNTVVNKGAWQDTTQYTNLQIVSYNDLWYISISDSIPIGTPPSNSDYWSQWATTPVPGEQGASGLGLSPRGEWSSTIIYYTYDLVTYEGKFWYANTENINIAPSEYGATWSLAPVTATSISTSVATTLSTSWVGTSAPYTQTITVTGLGVSQDGFIGVAQAASPAQRLAARKAILSILSQSENSLTIVCDGTKPIIEIPIVVTKLGYI